MSEFDNSWPGWQLKTEPNHVLERIADPLGGLILVETGVDAGGVISTIGKNVDELVGPTKSEATLIWSHWDRRDSQGEPTYEKDLTNLLVDSTSVLDDLVVAVSEIIKPIIGEFKPNLPSDCSISESTIMIAADRRSQLRPSHTDFDIVTAWLGATKPALKVFNEANQEWLPIDDVPSGYALFWRGALAYNDDKVQLSPIRHYAQYRSVIRRVVMLGH
jgi:hypothetical protein